MPTSEAWSGVTAAVATPASSRHLPLAGTYNVRDVGGYRTADGGTIRWRTLLRADSLHRLDDAGRAILRGYGLRTVLDLRRPSEAELAPNPFSAPAILDGSGSSEDGTRDGWDVAYVALPLAADPARSGAAPRELTSLDLAYRRMLDERRDVVAAALRRLAAPDGFPALVHCTAGKDRTGLIVALLLGLAGVPDDVIAEDYALSGTYLGEPYLAEARERAVAGGHAWEAYQNLLVCPAELMAATLAYLRERYGGVAAYLRSAGLADTELARLREALVEQEPRPA